MDIVIGERLFETVFHGEKVTMRLTPLKRKDYLIIMKYYDFFNDMAMASKDQSKLSGQQLATMVELIDDFAPVFPQYVKDIEGISVNGLPVTAEVLIGEAIFINFAMEIISQLIQISTLTDGEQKNSSALPGTQPQGSASAMK